MSVLYVLQNIGASDTTVATACNPLAKIGNMSLNPCGLIANSYFTGIYVRFSTHRLVDLICTSVYNVMANRQRLNE